MGDEEEKVMYLKKLLVGVKSAIISLYKY